MKLVRDKIPDIIKDSGKRPMYRSVHGRDEHLVFLRNKMVEEVDEFVTTPCIEEAADMYEVLVSFCRFYDLSFEDVIKVAMRKRIERGGFMGGIVLEGVAEHDW